MAAQFGFFYVSGIVVLAVMLVHYTKGGKWWFSGLYALACSVVTVVIVFERRSISQALFMLLPVGGAVLVGCIIICVYAYHQKNIKK